MHRYKFWIKRTPCRSAWPAPRGAAWLVVLWMASLPGCAPEKPARPPIKLSAGVALAQTGPEGTLLSFSVDYRFMDGKPDPAARYLWIIQPGSGEPLEQEVRLRKKQDTLQAMVPHWRPENGPFQTQIVEVAEDGNRKALSPMLPLR